MFCVLTSHATHTLLQFHELAFWLFLNRQNAVSFWDPKVRTDPLEKIPVVLVPCFAQHQFQLQQHLPDASKRHNHSFIFTHYSMRNAAWWGSIRGVQPLHHHRCHFLERAALVVETLRDPSLDKVSVAFEQLSNCFNGVFALLHWRRCKVKVYGTSSFVD